VTDTGMNLAVNKRDQKKFPKEMKLKWENHLILLGISFIAQFPKFIHVPFKSQLPPAHLFIFSLNYLIFLLHVDWFKGSFLGHL
jgi:hypothetical protein